MDHHSAVVRYYQDQAGSGIGNVYHGASFQRGHGLGSFLGGLARIVFPLFRSGAAAVGREAARAGAHVLSDVASGSSGFQQALKRRAGEAGQNLTGKLADTVKSMTGNGAKRRRCVRKRQSSAGSRKRKVSKSPRKQSGKGRGKKRKGKRAPSKRKSTKKTSASRAKRSSSLPDIFG